MFKKIVNLCFSIFGKSSKIQIATILGEFDEITLSHMVKEIEASLCFSIFGQKFENSKWPPFLRRGKVFGKLPRVHFLDILWVENFDEIALSCTVKEIEVNLC